jgi:hypothetical protein
LLPRQGHHQLRTESFPYLALVHAPARASHLTTSLSTACYATGDEGKREQSEPVRSHV